MELPQLPVSPLARARGNREQTRTEFPTPNLPPKERAEFIKEYLEDDEDSIRTQLADKIEAGEELTIFIKAA